MLQTRLHLHPLTRCLLICCTACDQSAFMGSQVVPSDTMVRMEFHVEAVLDMVAQISDPILPTGLTEDRDKWVGKSVQDCWDRFDCEARNRLTDLTESPMGRQLVEFYLSEVEYDLTEPLTTNSSGLIRRPCPTARLDLLPPCRYAEFLTDSSVEPDSTSFDSTWHAQLLHTATPDVGVFSDLCASLLSDSSTDVSEPLPGVVGLSASGGPMLTDVTAQESTSHYISSTPRLEDGSNEVERTGSKLDHVGMHTSDGRIECVDWVVLLGASDRLHFVFVDTDEVFSASSSSIGNQIPGNSACRKTSFPIYLPSHLRSAVLDDFDELDQDFRTKPHPSDNDQEDNLARLITVTLVYATAWWRAPLRQLMVDVEGSKQSESPTHRSDEVTAELFAFLPDDRENRGFCHLFRDMYPQLSSPGVLQTQIFAAAADHWWSKGDALLLTMVDRHLTSRLMKNSTHEYLIGSHVARMQHVTSPPSDSNVVRATSISGDAKDEQFVRLRPNAWEVLARQCHILIPDLFPNLTAEISNGFVKQPPSVWGRCVSSTSRASSSQAQMPGIDVLSSAVQSGLYTAERVLRCFSSLSDHATRAGSFSPSALLIGRERSLIDSSNCVDEFTGTGDCSDSSPHSSSFAGDGTVRVQQRFANRFTDRASHFLKRT
ncbi:hypothetical protein EG68_10403 [Paragonimus skrjabini miyazakii]|uniref:Uncharacterized protein n=1 Tax=Paragonimus skrjabini miyazakii TaxID=59628 RepID=A0A8S9YTI9_9TREM|nr:hypothetical protein EG68_10403 [Paragonimus skrjabini miyazakii]